MAKKISRWLHDVVAGLTSAPPPRRIDPDSRAWRPRSIAGADLANPYFLAMLDRDAGWYLDRIGPDVPAGRP